MWGRGLAHFPPGTAVLGHGPEGSMGPRLSLPLRTVVGSRCWGGVPGTRQCHGLAEPRASVLVL